MTTMQQKSWIYDRAIFSTEFGDISLFNAGGTDYSIYYNLPTGGKDTAALAVGRIQMTLTPYNRPLVWEFYAAQTAGGVSGHRLIKNARTVPNRKGVLNLSPTQVRCAQLQRGNGKRLYLGKLRLAYAPANNYTGEVLDTDVAVEVSMRAEVQTAGSLSGDLPSSNWQMVSMGKGTMASNDALKLYSSEVTLDAAFLTNQPVEQAIYTDDNGNEHFVVGDEVACLTVNDSDPIYSGMTWDDFLTANRGATFQLEMPVTLQVLNTMTGDPLAEKHSSFINVYIGVDKNQVNRAILYGIKQDNQVVYAGTCAIDGETPYGTGQISIRRSLLLQAEAGGNSCVVNIDETFAQVVDRKDMGGKRNKSGKLSHKRGKHQGREKLVPLPSAVSTNVTPQYFFYNTNPAVKIQMYNELFHRADNPIVMGLKFNWKKFVKDLIQIVGVVAEALL